MHLPKALAVTLLFFSINSFASRGNDGQILVQHKTITIEEFYGMLFSKQDSVLTVIDCVIVFPQPWNWLGDEYDSLVKEIATANGTARNPEGQFIVTKRIHFEGNDLRSETSDPLVLRLKDLRFEKRIFIGGRNETSVVNCSFTRTVQLVSGTRYWFEGCDFATDFLLETDEFDLIGIKSCDFRFSIPRKTAGSKVNAYSGNETLDSLIYGRRNLIYGFTVPGITIRGSKGVNFLFEKNVVSGDSVNRFACQFNDLERFSFFQNDIGIDFSLQGSTIGQHANITTNNFRQNVSFTETVFPQYSNKVDWSALSGRINFLENFPDDDGIVFAVSYEALTNEELANDRSYLGLMKTYQQLNQIFKVGGDINAANSCYSQMKDIEGKKLRHDYRAHGGFQRFFRWQLNRLMKSYTEHGTNPAKAIVMSIYIVLVFAMLYFFFPSEWDKQTKQQIIVQFRDFIEKNDKGYVRPFLRMLGAFSISFLNAFTLSLNSFTTLGFGNIPTNGVARYVCVLEGFVGWFLLSIFTVALINQVMF